MIRKFALISRVPPRPTKISESKIAVESIRSRHPQYRLTPSPRRLEAGAVSLPQGRRPVTPAGGARAVPAGRGSSPPLPGGFGKTPGRHYDRPAIGSLDWDRRRRSNGRRSHVPGSADWSRVAALVRCHENRGGTPVGAARPAGRAPHRERCGLVGWRLPAFRLPCLIGEWRMASSE